MRTIVLGCGPAGLIAAKAANDAGSDVAIFSKPRKSHMNGAQYLHEPIFGINCGDPFEITYEMQGPPEAYREKVYGRTWDGTVSPEDLETSHQGWDIRLAYDALWNMFSDIIKPWDATPAGLRGMIQTNKPDLVVSTIPAPLLCGAGHTFRAAKIFSTDRAMVPLDDNHVLCNGNDIPRWYRASCIQGFENTEWPAGTKPPIVPMWEVTKPLDNNCTCWPGLLHAGRYGKWKKGVLSHQAYQETADVVARGGIVL